MIKVIFNKDGLLSRFPVQYYVKTDNYRIAEKAARKQLDKDKPNNKRYNQTLMVAINPIEP